MRDSGLGWMKHFYSTWLSRNGILTIDLIEVNQDGLLITCLARVPIMTNSESLLQFNAYAKPATALVVLRETIIGRELFDQAFKEFSERWKFKRPTPYDFFRTMEEASGVDLDWFWRGWFYSTDHVDIALENIHIASLDTLNLKLI